MIETIVSEQSAAIGIAEPADQILLRIIPALRERIGRPVLGNIHANSARQIRQRLAGLNRCFTSYFDKGEAQEGRVVVNFTVEVGRAISEARVAESTVDNDEVSQCIRGDVLRWSFRPIDIAGLQAARTQASAAADGIDGPALSGGGGGGSVAQVRVVPVTVTYPFEFRVPAVK